jgi:hypothetical protein
MACASINGLEGARCGVVPTVVVGDQVIGLNILVVVLLIATRCGPPT